MISASVQFGPIEGGIRCEDKDARRSSGLSLICMFFVIWQILGGSVVGGARQLAAQELPPVLVPTSKIKYLTGGKLDRRNVKPLSVWWRDAQIRDRLTAFSANEAIAIVIDRRVDPGQLLNVGVENRTVEQFLWEVANVAGLGVCRFEDCYYVGPVETVAMLPILEAELKTMARKKVRRSSVGWTSRRPLQTGAIVEPQAILEELGRTNGFAISGLEQVPYDLWGGFSLPPTTLYARLQIVLASFNKTLEISSNGKTITIVDFPETKTATREFPVAKRFSDAANLKRQFPDLKLTFRGKSIVAKGSPLELAKLKRELVRRVKVEAGDEIVFTLKNEASRMTILRTIAANGNLELVLESGERSVLNEIIQIDVVKVSRGELIFKTLEGTGLRGKVEAGKLAIESD